MAKVWNYIILTIGLAFLLTISGIEMGFTGAFDNFGLNMTDTNEVGTQQIVNSTLWLAIFGASGIFFGILAGVVATRLTGVTPENYVLLGFITGTAALYLGVWTSILNYAIGLHNWITYVVLTIFIPLTVGFAIALMEWFRGTD